MATMNKQVDEFVRQYFTFKEACNCGGGHSYKYTSNQNENLKLQINWAKEVSTVMQDNRIVKLFTQYVDLINYIKKIHLQ